MIPRWGAALLAWACASAPDAPAGLSEAQSARRYAELLTAENPRQAPRFLSEGTVCSEAASRHAKGCVETGFF